MTSTGRTSIFRVRRPMPPSFSCRGVFSLVAPASCPRLSPLRRALASGNRHGSVTVGLAGRRASFSNAHHIAIQILAAPASVSSRSRRGLTGTGTLTTVAFAFAQILGYGCRGAMLSKLIDGPDARRPNEEFLPILTGTPKQLELTLSNRKQSLGPRSNRDTNTGRPNSQSARENACALRRDSSFGTSESRA